MWFYVQYADGDLLWMPWSKDLEGCQAFGELLQRERALFLLRYKTSQADKERALLNKTNITEVSPGDVVYVDLRGWNAVWYDELKLPDAYTKVHVVRCQYATWVGNDHKKIYLRCDLFDENILYQHYDVYCYGVTTHFAADRMVLVDEAYCVIHPDVLPTDERRERLLARYTKPTPRGRGKRGGVATQQQVA